MQVLELRKKFPEAGVIAGVIAGAAAVYFGDPHRGRRRRAHARDKAGHVVRTTVHAVDRSVRDLGNRGQGIFAGIVDFFLPAHIPDEVLQGRVRARLGRLVSHPGAIEVRVAAGTVILRGDVLAHEADRLRTGVNSVAGVREVIDELQVHDEPGSVPSLQGKPAVRPRDPELLRDRWAPATRALAGAAGLGLLAVAAKKCTASRRCTATLMGLAGGGLLLRSITNIGPVEGLGLDPEASGIAIQKTTTIEAPVQRVFDLLVNPEKLPRVMDHVREVSKIDDTHFHWTVIGPAGTPLSWESEITRIIPNELLAWRSGPGAAVKNEGVVQFEPTDEGGTRVHIRMHYLPPGGYLGHAVAELLDIDAKHVLDEDLTRLKSLVERGTATIHHRKIKAEDVEE